MTDRIDAFDPFEPLTADEAEPDTSGPEGSGRRWSVPASVPARPTPRGPFLPVGRTEPIVREPAHAHGETPQGTVRLTDMRTAGLREVALPELRAALARLAERGHEIVLDDRLDEDEPALSVRFRPDRGPLAGSGPAGARPARFELRLGLERGGAGAPDAGVPDGALDQVHVIAVELPASVAGGSTVLGQTELRRLTRDWVAHRFVEFVEHVLERS